MKALKALGVLVLLVLAIGFIAGANDKPAPAAAAPAPTAANLPQSNYYGTARDWAPLVSAPATTAPVAPDPNVLTDGTYTVGDEIKPGTYKTEGPKAADSSSWSGTCYYATYKTVEAGFGDIIKNDAFSGKNTMVVSGKAKAVELTGGCTWRKQ